MTENDIANRIYFEINGSSMCVAPRWTPPRWFECDVASVTRAGYLVEHEIKLSKSDYRADRRKSYSRWNRTARQYEAINKHESLARGDVTGPSRFWFVFPDGMISPYKVPAWAGIKIVTPSPHHPAMTIKVVRKAPRLHNHKADIGMVGKMARNLAQRYWSDRITRNASL